MRIPKGQGDGEATALPLAWLRSFAAQGCESTLAFLQVGDGCKCLFVEGISRALYTQSQCIRTRVC